MLRDDCAGLVDEHGLRALRADIDADDVIHSVSACASSRRALCSFPGGGLRFYRAGFSNTLIESSEFATLIASSHSSSEKPCVTMPFDVTSPRANRSIATG